MNRIIRNIPNTITCINLLGGCMAILCSVKGAAPLWGLPAWQWSAIFIAIAAVADFCDGFAARLLRAYSNLGKELDSLCDLVSFGVAPAFLLYYALQSCGVPEWTGYVAGLIPVCGALRLARFNIDTRQTTSFIGLPIPGNAIFWIGFVALVYSGAEFATLWYVDIAVIAVVSWLMVSPIPLFSLKFKTWGWQGNQCRWMLIASAPVLLFCAGLTGLMWLIVVYLLLSLFDSRS